MPAQFDDRLTYDSGELFNSLAAVGGNVPVYDTLALYNMDLRYDRSSGPYDVNIQYDIAFFYNAGHIDHPGGTIVPYDAIRVFDGPSLYDNPPA